MCHFRVQKHPICPEQNSFGANHYYYFHLPIGPFHCAKLKKNSYRGSRVLKMYDIWTPNNPFSPNNFFGQLLILFACTYQPLSLCKIFKKFFQWIQSHEVVPFLGPRQSNLPKWEFFSENLLMSFISPSFMPIYMPKIKVRH